MRGLGTVVPGYMHVTITSRVLLRCYVQYCSSSPVPVQDVRYVVVPNAAYIINTSWLPLKGRMIKEQERKEMLYKMQSAVHCFSYHHCFLKGKKGMIKFQAVYWMANVLFFTRNQKEIRELVVKVLEARVKHVDSCCTARKEYNLNLRLNTR
jgi:hypothetical protein